MLGEGVLKEIFFRPYESGCLSLGVRPERAMCLMLLLQDRDSMKWKRVLQTKNHSSVLIIDLLIYHYMNHSRSSSEDALL